MAFHGTGMGELAIHGTNQAHGIDAAVSDLPTDLLPIQHCFK